MFYLHNTRVAAQPINFGLVFSDAGIAFADDGFGTFISVNLNQATCIIADGFDERQPEPMPALI